MRMVAILANTVTLNVDILTGLVWYIELNNISSLLALMETCKTMYSAGVPALLNRDIRFADDQKLLSFCNFILADLVARARCIRAITFTSRITDSTHMIDDAAICKLVNVLQHATHLHTLSLYQCDTLLSLNSCKLSETISGLKTLRNLSVDALDLPLTQTVKSMQSPVEKVTMTLFGHRNPRDHDCIYLLSAFQHTLREVFLWWPVAPRMHRDILYPNVHSLSITFWDNVDSMGPIISAFPAVEHLSLETDGYNSDPRRRNNGFEEPMHVIRARNKADQRNVHWRYIKSVDASDVALHVTALRARIGTLNVLAYALDGPCLAAVLNDACPTERFDLTLQLKVSMYGISKETSARFMAMLEAAAATVTHLYIKIVGIGLSYDIVDTVQLGLTGANMVKLAHISLFLSSESNLTYKVIAQRFALAVPTLCNVVVATKIPEEATFWRITRGQHEQEWSEAIANTGTIVQEHSCADAGKLGFCADSPPTLASRFM